MAIGMLGVRTTSGTTGAAALEIIAPSRVGSYLKSIRITLAAATASVYAVGRPAAKGVTPTTPVRVLNISGGDAFDMDTKTALAWATPPTSPTVFFTRVSLAGVIGELAYIEFPNSGLFIPADETLVLWNLGTNSVVDAEIKTNEV